VHLLPDLQVKWKDFVSDINLIPQTLDVERTGGIDLGIGTIPMPFADFKKSMCHVDALLYLSCSTARCLTGAESSLIKSCLTVVGLPCRYAQPCAAVVACLHPREQALCLLGLVSTFVSCPLTAMVRKQPV
jgi:hypothetical protein